MKALKYFPIAGLLMASHLQANTLVFKVDNIRSEDGKVLVQIFKGKSQYNNNTPHSAQIIPAAIGQVTATFPKLEPGTYVIRFFHDENNNFELDKNLLGRPIEGYGFSNNAKANFGAPSFEEIAVKVKDKTVINHSLALY